MADLAVNPRAVSPLVEADARNFTASASGNVGDVVRISGDRTVAPTDATQQGTAGAYGVVVAAKCEGALTFGPGDGVSVVFHGPVAGFVGNPTALAYVSNTPGKAADAAGMTPALLGRMEGANILFVKPALV